MSNDEQVLARIDERTKNIQEDIKEIKTHIIGLDSTLDDHRAKIISLEECDKGLKEYGGDNRKLIIWVITGITALATGIVVTVLRKAGIL